jgi:signal transduction histidine kinase
MWRNLAMAIVVFYLLLTPFQILMNRHLISNTTATLAQAQGLLILHSVIFAVSLASVAVLVPMFQRSTPGRYDLAFLRFGTHFIVLMTAAMGVINQLGSGSITAFAITAILAGVMTFEQPRKLMWSGGLATALVLGANVLLQSDPAVATSNGINSVVVSVVVFIFNPYFDRQRFLDHQRKQRLQTLLEANETLLRALGHDLRTPLIEVRRAARILEETIPMEPAQQRTLASDLDAFTKRSSMVLDNLLQIGRQGHSPGTATPAPISLLDLVQRARDLANHDAQRKEITIHDTIDDDVMIASERDALVSALSNVLNNAIKFTPRGGSITLALDTTASEAILTVTDTGIGIAAEVLERIRRGDPLPPSTGTEGEPGIGIGLFVTQKLLQRQNVTLEVAPVDPQRGTPGTVARIIAPRYRTPIPGSLAGWSA